MPVRALALEMLSRLVGLEQPEEEHPEQRVVPHAPVGFRLAQPAANLGQSCIREGVGLRPPGLGRRLLDELLGEEPPELGIDLAVTRRVAILAVAAPLLSSLSVPW